MRGRVFRVIYIYYHVLDTALLFIFWFGGCLLFIYLFCLIALTRTSSNVFNKSSKSWHSRLALHLREKAFSLSPFSMMLAVGLSYMDFIMLRYIASIAILLRVFIMNDVEFCQILSVPLLIFTLLLLKCSTLTDWQIWIHPYWKKSNLAVVYDSLNILL